ncbi:MAG: hypothetical protein KDI68_16295 [Gammaproteobacteria bacterium]|nr:hypothetical protein [Gammaproteobacteria bacterium]
MIGRVALIALVCVGDAMACTPPRIEAAAALVLQVNPLVQVEREQLEEQARQKSWSAHLSLGYGVAGNDENAADTTAAAIQVEIPLFDRSHRLKLVEARVAYQQQRDRVLAAFLAEVLGFCRKADLVQGVDRMRRFYRDRLRYRQEQVEAGLEEPERLWTETEKVQQTENDYRRDLGELKATRLVIARRFGGTEWKRLRALLAETSR